MTAPAFTLFADEVPDPPASGEWVNILRWMLCVMNTSDARLPYVARCLAIAVERGGLHPVDSDPCHAIAQSVMRDFAAGILICQNTEAPEPAPVTPKPEPEPEPEPTGPEQKKRLH